MSQTKWMFDTSIAPPNSRERYLFENSLTQPATNADYMSSGSKRRSKPAKKRRFDDDNPLPSVERVGQSRGNTPRDNREQNRQINALARQYGLTKSQRDRLHRRVGGQGYGYQEIKKIIEEGDYFQVDIEATDTKTWLFELPFSERADYMAVSKKLSGRKTPKAKAQISVPKPTSESGLIALENAPAEVRKMGWKRGIYVIFRDNGRVYVGKADKTNLAVRIAQHRSCLRHLRIPTNNYKVKVFHFPNATAEQIHAAETYYRQRFPIKFDHLRNTEWEDVLPN